MVEMTELTIIANVETRIPPPVDPEPAPTNIKKRKNTKTGKLKLEKSTVLKPALRVVIELNKVVTTFPNADFPSKLLLYSKMKKTIAPKTNKNKVVYNVIFVSKRKVFQGNFIRFLKLFRPKISNK